jgi:L-fucose isomerase-like protein
MASSLLYRLKRYYKYLYAPFNDKTALKTIKDFLKSVDTTKKLRKTKIGLVGYHAPGYYSFSFDELRLRQQIGPEIRHIDLGEARNAIKEISTKDIKRIMNEVNDKVALNNMSKDIFEKYARAYGAFRLVAKRYDCNSLAVKCWPEVDKYFGVSVCAMMAKLTDDGIIAGCEGDVYGTVTMLMQYYLTNKPPFIVDLVHIMKEKNTAVLWHCGNAPFSLAGDKKDISIVRIPNVLGEGWGCRFGCKSGKVTFAKLSESEEYRMLLTTGRAINGKAAFCGTSVKVKFAPEVTELMDVIIYQGFEHHFSIIYQDVVPELEDICGMLNIKVVKV